MVTPFVSSISSLSSVPPLKFTSIHVTNYTYVINFIHEHNFIHVWKSIFGLYYIHNNWVIVNMLHNAHIWKMIILNIQDFGC
jgi:hypothetical protein